MLDTATAATPSASPCVVHGPATHLWLHGDREQAYRVAISEG